MISACVPGGVHTSTTCTSSRSIADRHVVDHSGMPYARAALSTATGVRPVITRTRGSHGSGRIMGATRYAYACAFPIPPYPTIATPSSGTFQRLVGPVEGWCGRPADDQIDLYREAPRRACGMARDACRHGFDALAGEILARLGESGQRDA